MVLYMKQKIRTKWNKMNGELKQVVETICSVTEQNNKQVRNEQ